MTPAEKARDAASRTVGEVKDLRHVRSDSDGGETFVAVCDTGPREVRITINPNGRRATLEWSSGTEGRNYKVCDVQDVPPSPERAVSDTGEEKALP